MKTETVLNLIPQNTNFFVIAISRQPSYSDDSELTVVEYLVDGKMVTKDYRLTPEGHQKLVDYYLLVHGYDREDPLSTPNITVI